LKETKLHIGDVINETNKLNQPQFEPGVGNKPSGMALWDPRIRSQLEYMNAHPEMRQGTPVGGGAQPPMAQKPLATEDGQKAITDQFKVLTDLLRGTE
jgi:hypothetical protein